LDVALRRRSGWTATAGASTVDQQALNKIILRVAQAEARAKA
jgi:hypothetical protein